MGLRALCYTSQSLSSLVTIRHSTFSFSHLCRAFQYEHGACKLVTTGVITSVFMRNRDGWLCLGLVYHVIKPYNIFSVSCLSTVNPRIFKCVMGLHHGFGQLAILIYHFESAAVVTTVSKECAPRQILPVWAHELVQGRTTRTCF